MNLLSNCIINHIYTFLKISDIGRMSQLGKKYKINNFLYQTILKRDFNMEVNKYCINICKFYYKYIYIGKKIILNECLSSFNLFVENISNIAVGDSLTHGYLLKLKINENEVINCSNIQNTNFNYDAIIYLPPNISYKNIYNVYWLNTLFKKYKIIKFCKYNFTNTYFYIFQYDKILLYVNH